MVAVVALLLTLHLSAVASMRDQTLRAQCAAHLRQLALATTIIADDNGDKLPVNTSGYWPWDMSWNVGNMLTQYVSVQTLYCPASGFTPAENKLLWGYASGSYHVTSYAQTFSGTSDVTQTNLNTTLTPQRTQSSIPPIELMSAPPASRRVLFADSTISMPGQNYPPLASSYDWIDIPGGFIVEGRPTPFRTDHMDGTLPVGGNLAMLDGHVEWRSFPLMVSRSATSGDPVWWW